MNFESLGQFEAVARHRSFVNAAEHLHMSQPALTRSIQVLEREFGGRLFDRRPHKVELTGFGSFVLERVRALISSQQQLNRDIDQFKGVECGNLYVGFGPVPAETLAGCTSSEPFGQVSNRIKRGSGPSGLKLRLRMHGAAGVVARWSSA